MKRTIIIVLICCLPLIALIPIFQQEYSYERNVYESLYYHKPFDGHAWYIAPMEGKTVILKNNTPILTHGWKMEKIEGGGFRCFEFELIDNPDTLDKNSYFVIRDYWDSCEHNPNQNHYIAVDYVNKTLYLERVQLDKNVDTRHYIETRSTLVWVNSSLVQRVN